MEFCFLVSSKPRVSAHWIHARGTHLRRMDTGGRTATLGDVATYFGGGCGAAASYFWSTPAFAYDEITVVGYPEFPTSPEFCLCFVYVVLCFMFCVET